MSQNSNFDHFIDQYSNALVHYFFIECIRSKFDLSSHDDSFKICGDDSFEVCSTERAASSKIGGEREVSIMRIDPTKHYPPVRIRLVGKKGVMVDLSYPVEFASDEVTAKLDEILLKVLNKIDSDESYYDAPQVVTDDCSNDKITEYPSVIKEEGEDDD